MTQTHGTLTHNVHEGDRAIWLPGYSVEHQQPVTVVKVHARQVTILTDDGDKYVVSWRTVVTRKEQPA